MASSHSLWHIAGVALGLVPAMAMAQSVPDPLAAMIRCRGVTDISERARCYDAAWDVLNAARERKQLVILQQEEVRQVRRGLFGLDVKFPLIGGDEDVPVRLEGTIVNVTDMAADRQQFSLESGAVWQTTEPPRGGIGPRAGMTVIVTRGVVGTYVARFGRSTAPVRVKRVR